MDKLELECLNYLRSKDILKQMMDKIKLKYIKTQNLNGTIKLNLSSYEDKQDLSRFLGKNFYDLDEATIKISDIKKALYNSKFNELDFEFLFFDYYNNNLITNKQQKQSIEAEKSNFFNNLLNSQSPSIKEFLQKALNDKTKGVYKFLLNQYNINKDILLNQFEYLNQLDIEIKKYKIFIPILSANITKNPHSLDEGTFLNQLLTYYLCYLKNCDYPSNLQQKNILFYEFNILKDDLLNFCIIFGFNAYLDTHNKHQGFSGFNQHFEPHIVNVRNLLNLSKICAVYDKIYIFENPSVFNSYIYEMQTNKREYSSLICTNGQLNYSAYLFLDLIEFKNDTYYWGDFDPEGLIIADKLFQRYKNIKPYNYSLQNYYKSLSNETISDKRLMQLKNIKTQSLFEISNEILKIKKAGYQENLINFKSN